MFDDVVLAVNGTAYQGWKGMTVIRSLDTVCGSFELSVSDRWPGQNLPRGIREGDECQVLLGGEPVITGYVDSVSPAIASDEHSLAVRGRDKTCDLVDCSAEIESGEVWDQDIYGMATLLCEPYGIIVRSAIDVGQPLERFAIQPGESAFACLERAARQRGVLCTSDGEGSLVLSARGEFAPADDALVEGQNILAASGEYDRKDRYSLYRVLGCMPAMDDGIDDPRGDLLGLARDVNVMRHRPLILTCEAWTTPEGAETRAQCECASRAGRSTRVNIQTIGWRQTSGTLWQPGLTVLVTAPSLYLDQALLVVSTVRYSMSSESGQLAELELTKPDAYLDAGGGEVLEDPFDDD